jgi:hypothetical protein
MLRKVIFTVLALAAAWGLGNVVYETWMQGHVSFSSSRTHTTSDYSYANDHAKFLFYFSYQAFSAVIAVAMLLGLGWTTTTQSQPRVRKGIRVDNRTGMAILFGIAAGVIGACVSSFLITGQWFYPPTTPPADARHIFGFAALSCFICVFATMRLTKRGQIRISE